MVLVPTTGVSTTASHHPGDWEVLPLHTGYVYNNIFSTTERSRL